MWFLYIHSFKLKLSASENWPVFRMLCQERCSSELILICVTQSPICCIIIVLLNITLFVHCFQGNNTNRTFDRIINLLRKVRKKYAQKILYKIQKLFSCNTGSEQFFLEVRSEYEPLSLGVNWHVEIRLSSVDYLDS